MKNILHTKEKGSIKEKGKIMKIVPVCGLALLLALSSCNDKNATKNHMDLGNGTTLDMHPDYIVEQKPCQDTTSFEGCTEKKLILKHDGNIYVRADLDSTGAPVLYVGSHDANDSIEVEMGSGLLEIQSQ